MYRIWAIMGIGIFLTACAQTQNADSLVPTPPHQWQPAWTLTVPAKNTINGLVHDEDTLYFSGDGTIHAIDEQRGAQRWKTRLNPKNYTIMIGKQQVVAIALDETVTLNPDDGSIMWQRPIGGFMTIPTIHHNQIILQQDDGWYALDLDDGRQTWQIPLTSMQYVCGSTPDIFYYFNRGMITAANSTTGTVLWSRPTTGFCQESQGIVLAATENPLQLHAYDGKTGSELWSLPSEIAQARTVNQTLYTFGASGVQAIDLQTGRSRWTNPTITGQAGFGVVEDAESVYFYDVEGEIAALSLHDGAIRWRLDGYPSISRDPFMHLAHDHLYVWPSDTFIELRLDTGMVERTFKPAVIKSIGTMGAVSLPLFVNQFMYTLYTSNQQSATLFAVQLQP